MKKPIIVRPLADFERSRLQVGLQSSIPFLLRRCQILLASADGIWPPQIARIVGCTEQTVRNVIREFERDGIDACLNPQRRRPLGRRKLGVAGDERLRALLHQSPQTFGKSADSWTLSLVAEACYTQRISREAISTETVRRALQRLGVTWEQVKHWSSRTGAEDL